MVSSGTYTWLFFLSCFAVQSANCDDLHQQFGKYLDNFKAEIERKYDAKLLALEEKFKNEISELKQEFVHREDAYRTVIDQLQKELKHANQMVDETDENKPGVGDTAEVNHDEINDSRDEVKSDKSQRACETLANYQDKRGGRQRDSNIKRVMKRQFGGPKVAFFASLTSLQSQMGVNQDIPFDNVLTNIGSGFNGHHGTFVAPVSGTYVLFATVFGSDWGQFMVNGNAVATFDMHNNGQCSQTIVIHMIQGDDAAVQTKVLGQIIHGRSFSTFSGFLLYPDDSEVGTTIVG